MASNNLPTFHTYINQPDDDAPLAQFKADLIGKIIMLRDASARVQVEKNGRMVFENRSEGTAVRLIGMSYDIETDTYTVTVSEVDEPSEIMDLDPSAFDVSPSRPEGYSISQWVRDSGKQRERLYRRAKLIGWTHDQMVAAWKPALAAHDHDLEGLTDAIDYWLECHPAPASNKPAFGGSKRQVNTSLASLRRAAPPVPTPPSRVSSDDIEESDELLAEIDA